MIPDDHDTPARRHTTADTVGATSSPSLVPPQGVPSHCPAEQTLPHDHDEADESHLVRGYD